MIGPNRMAIHSRGDPLVFSQTSFPLGGFPDNFPHNFRSGQRTSAYSHSRRGDSHETGSDGNDRGTTCAMEPVPPPAGSRVTASLSLWFLISTMSRTLRQAVPCYTYFLWLLFVPLILFIVR
ncbi:hypothetical protein E2C01_028011 [Portunus trituberculatus]|uniref:Uncharacterized protein n=1 Tax=Portunus trituberculatus TaxID=210409 RepID=A0A5B7EN34_PORTR|nr:hypothetical protein [Portunus trituberculatus]